ncbi:MAG: GvpL/GvpF family gas vesicle protein, partial [Chloroflexota bacterium]
MRYLYMEQPIENQVGMPALGETPEEQAGCYVYCVVRPKGEFSLGVTGIQGQPVDTVVRDGLSAVVHLCPPRPYQSDDPEMVAALVMAHHQVVEAAWRRYGAVLPLRFNTIIKADGQRTASENLAMWLETGSGWLKAKLGQFDGKAEYGIQVLRDTEHLSHQVAQSSPEVKRLEEEIAGKPRGAAYMHRQKLEAML